ncbi:hypothetical protein ETD83_16425 [Actinomadura soli]|uniref:Uncharacterized protein n=1 Tax=Actinomadura soli TaxID=2508997 RepID=A0A5C4JBA4_9ACTN|nr:hypothetical protein [Actinomadura soli]TMR00518.1 hypothetical protein ETD83_16425 [Actinomadura soli]
MLRVVGMGGAVQYRSFKGRTEAEGSGAGSASGRSDDGATAEHRPGDLCGIEADIQWLMRRLGLGGQPAWFDDLGDAVTGRSVESPGQE